LIGFFLKLPLGTRYAYGLRSVLISGLLLAFGTLAPFSDSKTLWFVVTILALAHWVITGVYLWWERRWYRFFLFVFSMICTWFYIELSLSVWKSA
jgi:hypothetical protein